MPGVPSSTSTIGEVGVASTSTRVQMLVAAVSMWDLLGAHLRCPPPWALGQCRPLRQHRPCNLGGDHHDCSRSQSIGPPLHTRTPQALIRNQYPLERQLLALLLLPTTRPLASQWASSASMLKHFPGASPRVMSRTSSNKGRRLPLRVRVRLPKRIKKGEGRK